MNNFLDKISIIITDLSYLTSKRYQYPQKNKLILDYLRLRVKVFLNRWFKFKIEKFLSYEVKMANYPLFFEIFRQIFVRQSYYFETVKENPEIIDCGGNMGMSVLYFKHLFPKAKITVFEPSDLILPILKHNVSHNKLHDVTIEPFAVADKEGEAILYNRGTGSCGDTLVESMYQMENKGPDSNEKKHSIIKKTLSSYITNEIDLLKLDVEGNEELVLRDLDSSNTLNQIKQISLEYHYYPQNKHNNLSHILEIFDKNNFYYHIFLEEIKPGFFSSKTNEHIYYCLIKAYK